jgi:hypothetical protein
MGIIFDESIDSRVRTTINKPAESAGFLYKVFDDNGHCIKRSHDELYGMPSPLNDLADALLRYLHHWD